MRYVEASGEKLSAVGLGTWQFGAREWGYGDDYAEREARAILHRALDLGINLVDTAEIYAFGKSERIIGKAIADRRDEVFIATKLFPVLPLGPVIADRARRSAARLGVEIIDLYQMHWPNPVVPISAAMSGMRACIDGSRVRHVGVSNFNLRQWQTAEEHLGAPVLTNQVQFSLATPGPDDGLVSYAKENDRLIIAYSPLAQGLLSGKYDSENTPTDRARRGNPLFTAENRKRAGKLIEILKGAASDHDVSPSQIALAWLLHRPNVIVIPGASSVAQLESNVAAADVALSDEENELLTKAARDFDPMTGLQAIPGIARSQLRF